MKIIPAILENTFSGFEKQVKRFDGLCDLIQIDVMDGEFVDNVSFPRGKNQRA